MAKYEPPLRRKASHGDGYDFDLSGGPCTYPEVNAERVLPQHIKDLLRGRGLKGEEAIPSSRQTK
jgi:hypothetical protein